MSLLDRLPFKAKWAVLLILPLVGFAIQQNAALVAAADVLRCPG